VLFILFLIAQLPNQATAGLPKFEQFKVSEIFKGAPAAPQLKTASQRTFRTMIRDAAKKGPNFAGHYAVAEWGCGASCVSMAVIDVQSGAVYDGPTVDVSPFDAESAGFSYHVDSRLMIVRGCPNEKNCGAYYYEWTGSAFKLLRQVPLNKEPR